MNIIYIHTHDTGTYTSVYGNHVNTNNLLSFAKDATVFTSAYCVSPTCTPSRGALLTGMYPHNNGLVGLTHRGFKLKDNNKHLANYLKNSGYTTVISGIQHENGFWNDADEAKKLGYEEVLTTPIIDTDGDSYALWDRKNCKALCEYLERNKTNMGKTFISFGLFSTHREYPSTTIDSRYLKVPNTLDNTEENRRDTAGLHESLSVFDECFGKVIRALKEIGEYDNSIIIVTTDHGLANPFAKCNLTKDGTQVQLIIREPNGEKGVISDRLVSQLDIFPTICQWLNLEKPTYLEGCSMLEPEEEYVFQQVNFHTSYEPQRGIRSKRYVYITYLDDQWEHYNISNCDNSPHKQMLINHGWCNRSKPKELLFDLLYDPQEKNNLINHPDYQSVKEELSEQLKAWRRKTKDFDIDYNQAIQKYRVNKKSTINPSIRNEEEREA